MTAMAELVDLLVIGGDPLEVVLGGDPVDVVIDGHPLDVVIDGHPLDRPAARFRTAG